MKSLKNRKGQSTVEFALMMVFLMGIVLFYLQLALVSAVGNYAHYATFMAARAYLSAGPTIDDQRSRAQSVLAATIKKGIGQEGVDRWPGVARGTGGTDNGGMKIGPGNQFAPNSRAFSWLQGVRYTFRSRLLMVPFTTGESANSLTLTSESWLGREPTYEDCENDMRTRVRGGWVIDNGC